MRDVSGTWHSVCLEPAGGGRPSRLSSWVEHHEVMRPLARSLDPLPDEALTGYLLRLAHRLGVSPGVVAIRTGLTGGRKENVLFRIPMRLLHDLEPEEVRFFTRTTRLSPDEVSRLLTSSLAGRYGPADRRFTPRSSTARMVNRNAWLPTRTPRYCPQCLTGDESEIQRRHGGAWQLSWRLPPVFACPRHLACCGRTARCAANPSTRSRWAASSPVPGTEISIRRNAGPRSHRVPSEASSLPVAHSSRS
ncbi:TniQ family protein [Streptomyces sp. NPDC004830]